MSNKNYDTNEWITPWELIGTIEAAVNDQLMLGVGMLGKYKINFDLAATPENARAKKFWTKEDDALMQDWGKLRKLVGKKAAGVFPWLNPPYGARPGVKRFAEKIADGLDSFDLLSVLVNQDSTTEWHDILHGLASEIWQLSRRLKFGHPDPRAPKVQAARAQDLIWIPKNGHAGSPLIRLWDPRTGEFV